MQQIENNFFVHSICKLSRGFLTSAGYRLKCFVIGWLVAKNFQKTGKRLKKFKDKRLHNSKNFLFLKAFDELLKTFLRIESWASKSNELKVIVVDSDTNLTRWAVGIIVPVDECVVSRDSLLSFYMGE